MKVYFWHINLNYETLLFKNKYFIFYMLSSKSISFNSFIKVKVTYAQI